MKEKISETLNKLRRLKEQDIAYNTLGAINSFEAAEQNKNAYIDAVAGMLSETLTLLEEDSPMIMPNFEQVIDALLQQIDANIDSVNTLVKPDGSGIHAPNFPTQRAHILLQFDGMTNYLRQQAGDQFRSIQIAKLKRTIPDSGKIEEASKEINEAVIKAQEKVRDIDKIIEKIRDSATVQAVDISQANFQELTDQHFKNSVWWFAAISVTSISLLGLLVYSLFFSPVASATETNWKYYHWIILPRIASKVLAFSILSILLRICLTKFNAERSLSIIYRHRSKTLELYNGFDPAIDENLTAKHELRMELAKIVFSDPQTGYQSEQAGTDMIVNPVVNIAEKLSGKIPQPKP